MTTESIVDTTEIKEDDFLKSLKQPTEMDSEPAPQLPPPPKPDEPKSEKKGSDDDSDDDDDDLGELSNPALVTEILIETIDLLHNVGMQAIAGEPNPDLFKVPAQGKKRIKKATTKLIEKYNWQIHPGFVLVFLFLVVYGPTTVKAMAIRKQKVREKKIKNGEATEEKFDVKRGPGRPPGSTNKK